MLSWVKISTPSICNLDSLPPEKQAACIAGIEAGIRELKRGLEDNLRRKEHAPEVPRAGLAVLRQQMILAEAIEAWIKELKGA